MESAAKTASERGSWRFLHWFRHEWGMWMPFSFDLAISSAQPFQERRCVFCGLVDRREVPHVHQWGKWSLFSDLGIKSLLTGESRTVGEVQVRTCETCGFRELEKTVICE